MFVFLRFSAVSFPGSSEGRPLPHDHCAAHAYSLLGKTRARPGGLAVEVTWACLANGERARRAAARGGLPRPRWCSCSLQAAEAWALGARNTLLGASDYPRCGVVHAELTTPCPSHTAPQVPAIDSWRLLNPVGPQAMPQKAPQVSNVSLAG